MHALHSHGLHDPRPSKQQVTDLAARSSLTALRQRITGVLVSNELEIVYQPVIQLDTNHVEFFEALSRFEAPMEGSPERWFVAAAELGLGVALEILAARCAIAGLSSLPDGSTISVNFSPATILSKEFLTLFETAPLARVILEITENQQIHSYQPIIDALKPLRRAGLRIAIDDAGAGFSSFRHVLKLRPEVIKLDMSICRGIHKDHMRRALASALLAFSRQIGSDLVVEGVETARELECLQTLGMTIIQGFFVGRPMRPGLLSAARPRQQGSSSIRSRRLSRAA